MTSDDDIVLLDHRGQVGIVTLNRPDVLNAINLRMRVVLAETMTDAINDPRIRVIVLRGAGGRAFSAGADVTEFQAALSLNEARRKRDPPQWNDVIAGSPKPTIAAIEGYCLGGGLETALSCDLRIAADDAVFALPEVRLGIIAGAGGTQRLPRVVGLGNALRMILTGDRIDVTEALRIGLVSQVAPKAKLEAATLSLANQICENGPLALEYAKESARRGLDMSLADGLRLEADLANLLTNTKDRLEGAAAFKEKRKPRYTGE
jgi:enoyl-CoA hydratase/carnithine racemase